MHHTCLPPASRQGPLSHCQRPLGSKTTTRSCHTTSHRAGHTIRRHPERSVILLLTSNSNKYYIKQSYMNYSQLKLPSNPLAIGAIEYISGSDEKWGHRYAITDVPKIFNSDVLEIFKNLNITPYCVVIPKWKVDMISTPQELTTSRFCTPIHSDYFQINGHRYSYPCAINWELNNDAYVTWSFWNAHNNENVSYQNETFAAQIGPLPFNKTYLNGTRFDEKSTLLEQVDLQPFTPYLVNTSMPHCVEFNVPSERRLALSLRFNIEDIATWEQAVQIFKNYFV